MGKSKNQTSKRAIVTSMRIIDNNADVASYNFMKLNYACIVISSFVFIWEDIYATSEGLFYALFVFSFPLFLKYIEVRGVNGFRGFWKKVSLFHFGITFIISIFGINGKIGFKTETIGSKVIYHFVFQNKILGIEVCLPTKIMIAFVMITLILEFIELLSRKKAIKLKK